MSLALDQKTVELLQEVKKKTGKTATGSFREAIWEEAKKLGLVTGDG